jgi:hypothetical protein
VAECWQEPRDLDGLEREFGPCVDGTDPTRVFVILAGERAVGVIQTYRLDDNPGYAAAVGIEGGGRLALHRGPERQEPELPARYMAGEEDDELIMVAMRPS